MLVPAWGGGLLEVFGAPASRWPGAEHVGTPGHVGDAACGESFGVLPGWMASLGCVWGTQESPVDHGLL